MGPLCFCFVLLVSVNCDHRTVSEACDFCSRFGKCVATKPCSVGPCGKDVFCWSCGAFEWDGESFSQCGGGEAVMSGVTAPGAGTPEVSGSAEATAGAGTEEVSKL